MKLFAFVLANTNNSNRRVALGVGNNEQEARRTVEANWSEFASAVFEVQAKELT